MILRTLVRDCLLLNWALPAEQLPAPPDPLRYDCLRLGSQREVMVTALLFYHHGIRPGVLPFVRLTFPQLSLGAAVLDGDGQPALYFRRMLVPLWVLPAARLLTHQPAEMAALRFDRPSRQLEADQWTWNVRCRAGRLDVAAHQATPRVGLSSLFPTWRNAVDYFQQRRRSYFEKGGKLRCVETFYMPRVEAWPMAAEVADSGVLMDAFPLRSGEAWPEPFTAMLFPDLPLSFELALVPSLELAPMPRVAAATANREGLRTAACF